MNKLNVKVTTISAAMRMAMRQGFDPYNSHDVQARVMERRWKMECGARRVREREARSEAQANMYLSMFLRKQAG